MLFLFLWVLFIHAAGIYLFTSGFLLTRLALTNTSSCATADCTLPATHSRAVLLIIDSLRFDFISPEPPEPSSPFHHNVLSLPKELTAKYPKRSFIYNAYADPPTTTLQRLKGITTGSLPTFVDMGNNFGGSSIVEDSIFNQLTAAGKRCAFMGDDTWMSIFPDSFEKNMTFPYDSFNVEDLHTVDQGVMRHLFPLLEDKTKPFEFLVGHFLGVDHVGHRVGPDHLSMTAKLEEMNSVLQRVVDLLDDDTLLILMGDHGMDRQGDHGGDGLFETSSGLWIYSKSKDLSSNKATIPSGLLEYTTFPRSPVPHRQVQQIDLLPTISLLLGLPIPFNNLGTIIPELFWRDKVYERALEINSAQVKAYIDTYRASGSGNELENAWESLQSAWQATQSPSHKLITLSNFNRVALGACRAMWAQFNPILMGFGLALSGIGLLTTWSIYAGLQKQGNGWDAWLAAQLYQGLLGFGAGSVLGFLASSSFRIELDALDWILFAAPLCSCFMILRSTRPAMNTLPPLPLTLHTLSFLSNSFTFWEDRIVLFLSISSLVPFVLKGVYAPTSRLRYRILGFLLLFALCCRLISISTVCREEQQPYCHVTFYSTSSLPTPPLLVLILVVPTAAAIPWAVRSFLQVSKSHYGQARTFLPYILTPSLVCSAVFWILEFLDTAEVLGPGSSDLLRFTRTWLARLTVFIALFIGGVCWWAIPLNLLVELSEEGGKRQASIIGFANTFGSSYLLFWSIPFALVFLASQSTAQVVLGLGAIATVALLEIVDSVRDAEDIEEKPSLLLNNPSSSPGSSSGRVRVGMRDITPLALLGTLVFYGTGHQSTIPSIQWKTGFILTSNADYTFSPLTIILNTFGAWFLTGLGGILIGLWNRSPAAGPKLDNEIRRGSTLASLALIIYYTSLFLGTAVSAAILRRHLMVWKIFAPRFMFGVASLLAVDVGVLVGTGLGLGRITKSVDSVLGKVLKSKTS